jgi:fructose-specific phosphotransferase system component IIB
MEAALMIIAMTAIVGGIAYWYRSHEELKKATEGVGKKSEKHSVDTKTEDKE